MTGLFTDTQISKNSTSNITSSSAVAAVSVHVTLDGHPVAPDKGKGVIYDERFQQVSSNVFNQIAACAFRRPIEGAARHRRRLRQEDRRWPAIQAEGRASSKEGCAAGTYDKIKDQIIAKQK